MSAKDQKCKNFKTCHQTIRRECVTGLCARCYAESRRVAPPPRAPGMAVTEDRAKVKREAEVAELRRKYTDALKTIEKQELILEAAKVLGENLETHTITAREGSGTSEATPVLVASDWHVEENVASGVVSGLNKFDLDIARKRADTFFTAGLRLVQLLNQDVTIHTVVLALLGDFITNDIHEELKDLTEVAPVQAIVLAQNMLVSGIEFLLDHSKYNFIIPCHSGNHARTTKQTHFAAENGHSLEYLMYMFLKAHFRHEPRVQFVIPEGYHSYLDIYGKTIRFHHGHAIKYAGGVGGIFIPAYKAIAQWEKGRHADLDVFGHFHQMKDGGNFLCNGSLIGYNGFALAIKADFEKPRQTLFLVDKKRGRTCTWPIIL